uniref:Uncharacterized protein n=1 Tax=Cynoglossus semilaevis TaxID=244447 RepID=A0A3P8W933_CYNSE
SEPLFLLLIVLVLFHSFSHKLVEAKIQSHSAQASLYFLFLLLIDSDDLAKGKGRVKKCYMKHSHTTHVVFLHWVTVLHSLWFQI